MPTATPARSAPDEIGSLTVDIPVTAELLLKPEHAQARPATPEDLNRLGYRHSPTQYARFSDRLCALLGIEDLDDLSDAGSMLRYLVECAVMYDHETYSDPDIADMVAGLKMHETCISESDAEAARALDAMCKVLTKPADERRYPPEPDPAAEV